MNSFRKLALEKFAEEVKKFGPPYTDVLGGGKANKLGLKEKQVRPKELAMGIDVEQEHSPSKALAKEISLDHLTEFPDYYSRLKKMEEEGKKALSK